jgi:hypothetical protein
MSPGRITSEAENPATMAMQLFEHLKVPEHPAAIESAASSCGAAAAALRAIAGDEVARGLLAHVLGRYEAVPAATVVKALEQTAIMLGYKPLKATLRG